MIGLMFSKELMLLKTKSHLGILLAIIIALLKRSERNFKGLAISKLILC